MATRRYRSIYLVHIYGPHYLFLLLFFFFWLFIYLSLFLAALGLHYFIQNSSSCSKWGLLFVWCEGFSLWCLLLLQSTGSRHVGFSSCSLQARQHGLSSSGAQAQPPCGMWNPPWPVIESISSALASRLLSTPPAGHSLYYFCIGQCWYTEHVSIVG